MENVEKIVRGRIEAVFVAPFEYDAFGASYKYAVGERVEIARIDSAGRVRRNRSYHHNPGVELVQVLGHGLDVAIQADRFVVEQVEEVEEVRRSVRVR